MATNVLWVEKARENDADGETVFNRQLCRALERAGVHVRHLRVAPVGRRRRWLNMLHGLPWYRTRYYSRATARNLAAQIGDGEVVISWEPLDVFARCSAKPKTLLLHNITSDALRQIAPGNAVISAICRYVRRYERRLYGSERVKSIVVLSKRDRDLVREIAPDKRVCVAVPGAPPAVSLAAEPAFQPQLVLAGTYEWRAKSRDLALFMKEWRAAGAPVPILADAPLPGLSDIPDQPLESKIADGQMRVGLITDRFTAGHKLKTLYYIANNCAVVSFCGILHDFDHLPYAARFIREISHASELKAVLDEFRASRREELVEAFRTFKAAALKEYTWDRAAAAVSQAFSDEVGTGDAVQPEAVT